MNQPLTEPLKVAVIGARSNHQGTGPWLARFFSLQGAIITGVLGTSKQSAQQAAAELQEKFSISCRGFYDWQSFLHDEQLDLLVIASPSSSHLNYLKLAAEANLPVFCEKPLVWDPKRNNLEDTRNILADFSKKNLPLLMNTQWPETIDDFQRIYPQCDTQHPQQFTMHLSPASRGKDMLVDAMPHAWSMITALAGAGSLSGLKVVFKNSEHCDISGTYEYANGHCKFHITLAYHAQQPRPFSYSINGDMVERIIDVTDYSIFFKARDNIFAIEDPVYKRVKTVMALLAEKNTEENQFRAILDRIALEMELLVKTIEESQT